MMLEFLGETAAAQQLEKGVIKVVSEKLKSMAAGRMGYSTTDVGDMVADLAATL
jgi:3-isopropylmalate dehydrogenase